ncbi:MAG: hypothetical protein K0S39_5660 [Paenibacillus sp.]|jgi:hypothetical protein|nr:hypothetical protein [Paenibacillus sp.]
MNEPEMKEVIYTCFFFLERSYRRDGVRKSLHVNMLLDIKQD